MTRLILLLILLQGCTGLRYGNDILIPNGKDRYLTSDARFLFKDGYSLGSEVYTPTDKEDPNIPLGDRPWSSYLFVEKEDVQPIAWGQEAVFRYRLGGVGKYGFGEELQDGIHELLSDLGKPQTDPTWAHQNPGQVAGELIASRRSREYLQSVIGDSRLTNEYGLRVGNVVDEAFFDQELRKHFFKHWYFFTGITGKIVAFNTHIEGRLWADNNHEERKQWFVAQGRLGFEYRGDDWAIGYTYKYLTEEFKGQEGRHLYGSLEIAWNL